MEDPNRSLLERAADLLLRPTRDAHPCLRLLRGDGRGRHLPVAARCAGRRCDADRRGCARLHESVVCRSARARHWVPLGTRDIRLITAPYFLATKFEAFHGRGHGDVRGSHDLEDIVAVTSFNARNFCAVPVSARGCPLTY